jgi:hypothetical protein
MLKALTTKEMKLSGNARACPNSRGLLGDA